MIQVQVDTSKIKKQTRRIKKLVRKSNDVVMNELTKAAIEARNKILVSLNRGKKTGKVYTWRGARDGETPDLFLPSPLGHLFPAKERNVPHRASAPGEAPASDHGGLADSIKIDTRKNEIEVGSDIEDPPYPEWLEKGTRAMEARPFMKPVVDELEKDLGDRVLKAIINSAKTV